MKLNYFEKLALMATEKVLEYLMNKVNDDDIWNNIFCAACRIGFILDKSNK